MAGAAPGTTFGVDLGFSPSMPRLLPLPFRLPSVQTLRGTTSTAPRPGPTEPSKRFPAARLPLIGCSLPSLQRLR